MPTVVIWPAASSATWDMGDLDSFPWLVDLLGGIGAPVGPPGWALLFDLGYQSIGVRSRVCKLPDTVEHERSSMALIGLEFTLSRAYEHVRTQAITGLA